MTQNDIEPMKKKELEQAVDYLEGVLRDFREARARGKATNSNEERAQSISDIEEITQRLETYFKNKPELLEQITGTKIEVAKDIGWNDVVRPDHFEEDLQEEINKFKKSSVTV